MSDNKLVKAVTNSAVLIGLAAGVGYIGKKVLKENVLGDPSQNVMNYVKWTAVLASSIALKDYLVEKEKYYLILYNGINSNHAWRSNFKSNNFYWWVLSSQIFKCLLLILGFCIFFFGRQF